MIVKYFFENLRSSWVCQSLIYGTCEHVASFWSMIFEVKNCIFQYFYADGQVFNQSQKILAWKKLHSFDNLRLFHLITLIEQQFLFSKDEKLDLFAKNTLFIWAIFILSFVTHVFCWMNSNRSKFEFCWLWSKINWFDILFHFFEHLLNHPWTLPFFQRNSIEVLQNWRKIYLKNHNQDENNQWCCWKVVIFV